jgi:hypothetical protein
MSKRNTVGLKSERPVGHAGLYIVSKLEVQMRMLIWITELDLSSMYLIFKLIPICF